MNARNDLRDYRLASGFPELPGPCLNISNIFSEEYFELERERLFKKVWLMVCREDELPEIGDYIVKEIEVLRTSIVVTRARDGTIRGFHNMCSHRGNRIATHKAGKCKNFVCSFHGWVYDLEGKLLDIPAGEALFPNVDKSDHGLTRIAADTWEGFVFINMDPEPKNSLQAFLGPLGQGYEGFFSKFREVTKVSMVVDANWKICLDAFCESYHFATIHRNSAAGLLGTRENPYGFMEGLRIDKDHCLISSRASDEFVPSPTEQLVTRLAAGNTMNPSGERLEAHPPAINPSQLEGWMIDILILFPGLDVQVQGGGRWALVQTFLPITHNTTQYEMRILMPKPQNAAECLAQEYNAVYLRDTIREDYSTMEKIQSMINSKAIESFVLGEQEAILRNTHAAVERYVRVESR